MSSRWPLVCEIVGNLLSKGLDETLAKFKADTERAAAGS